MLVPTELLSCCSFEACESFSSLSATVSFPRLHHYRHAYAPPCAVFCHVHGEQLDIVIDIYVQSGTSLGLFFLESIRVVQVNHITKSEFKRMNTDTYDFNLQDKKNMAVKEEKLF